MARHHRNFWLDFGSKIGAPTFAATLVACFLSGEFAWLHGVLLTTGVALVYLDHRLAYHPSGEPAAD